MDEKRPSTASERSGHKLKTELEADDSGAPKAQTPTMEPERSATRIAKLGGLAGLKPLLGAWEQGGLTMDITSHSSTIMISGTASPIGSRHSLEKLTFGRPLPQAERTQLSKHKLTKEPSRGVADLVSKLSEHAVQAQREAAALQVEEAEREADEEGMHRIAASREKLHKFVQSNLQLKGAGVRSRDSPDTSLHSLQSKSKGILVMGTHMLDTGEAPDLPPYVYIPGAGEEQVSSEQRRHRKQYGARESDTQHQKRKVSSDDPSKDVEGATAGGATGPGLDDRRQGQGQEDDSSKWMTKREMDLSKESGEEDRKRAAQRGLRGKGDGQMGRKGEKDGLSDWDSTTDATSDRAGLPHPPPTTDAANGAKSFKGSRGSKGGDSGAKGSRRSGSRDSDADDKKHGKKKAGGKKDSKAATEKRQKSDAGEDKKKEGRKKEPKSETSKPEDKEDGDLEPSSSDFKDKTEDTKGDASSAAAQKRPSESAEPEGKAVSRGVRRVSPRERKWKEFMRPEKPAPAEEPPAPPPPPEEAPVVATEPIVEPVIVPEEPGIEQPPEETVDEEPPDEPPAEAPVEPVAAPERKESVRPSEVPQYIKRPIQIYKEPHFDFTRPFVFSYFRTKPCHYNAANQVPLKPDTMDRAQARLLNQWRKEPDKFRDEGERRAALELLAMDERVKAMQSSPGHIKSRLDVLTRLPSHA